MSHVPNLGVLGLDPLEHGVEPLLLGDMLADVVAAPAVWLAAAAASSRASLIHCLKWAEKSRK